MEIVNRLPPREVKGADKVLNGFVGKLASGNYCRSWPAITYDRETNQTRTAFFTEWFHDATPDDWAEFMAHTNALMGGPPLVVTETMGNPCADEESVEWLRSGRLPKPPRRN